jgi:hypothetical protein
MNRQTSNISYRLPHAQNVMYGHFSRSVGVGEVPFYGTIMINPLAVSVDGEWEAIYEMLVYAKSERFPSFAHMAASLYLDDMDYLAGKDIGPGGLYRYTGPWDESFCFSSLIEQPLRRAGR